MTVTGGELLLDLFQSQGIQYIFCSPGTEWTPVWEGLLKRFARGDNSLKYINCRHETLAFSMAQGYTRVTGKMAVVLVHSGVGLLSGAIAIRNSFYARVPMLILSGESYEHSPDSGVKPQGWQWLALLSDVGGPASLVQGYIKWANNIKNKDTMIDLVTRGCGIARAPSPGPVYLSVSPELLARSFQDVTTTYSRPVSLNLGLSLPDIAEAAGWLLQSRRPVIVTEYAGKQPETVGQLVELAESLSIPVFEFLPFFGNFPKSHPLYQGYEAAAALQEADTVLAAGSVLPWYPPSSCLRPEAKIIWLDDDSLHTNISHWGYRVDLALTADIDRSLTALIEEIKRRKGHRPENEERLKFWKNEHDKMLASWRIETAAERNKIPISSKFFLQQLRERLPAGSHVIDETLLHTKSVHRYLGDPDCYIRPNYGGLGVGFGEALGVKLAGPDRPVFWVVGDGAFNYNPVLAGLGLCQEYHLPIFMIIMNNGGYAAMKKGHLALYPQGWAASHQTFLGVDILPAPDYVKIAEAFGAYGRKLARPDDIEKALTEGLEQMAAGKAILMDVVSD
jgi:acetolactate synthase I/II/III large subunit